jgi:hypothetical protein
MPRFSLTLLASALWCASIPAQEREKGKSNFIDPRGEPREVLSKLTRGFTLWHGPAGWHLRAFSNKKEHQFEGVVKVEGGTIEAVTGVGLEGKGKDRWDLRADRTQLTFKLRGSGVEGLNFRLSPGAKKVRFDLQVDRRHDPDLIWIGHQAAHPQRAIFTFFAHHAGGQPVGFGPGEAMSYGIWHAGNTWHLRTATDNKKHRFHGKVTVEGGTIDGIDAFRLEDKGSVKDTWRLSGDRRELHFDFRTDGEIDGVDFRVSPGARKLHWDLRIDGKHMPQRVFLGPGGGHPERVPFSLPTAGGKK